MGTVQGRGTHCILIPIPGPPVPFARPRPHRSGKFYINPKRYREWRDAAQATILAAQIARRFPKIKEPVAGEVVALFARPHDFDRKRLPKEYLWRDTIPDGDNLMKAAFDAAEGILFDNDSRISRWAGTELYSHDRTTGVILHVSPAPQLFPPFGLAFQPCECWTELHGRLDSCQRRLQQSA